MHKELYGAYPEFQEANMVANLEAEHRRIGLRWAYEKGRTHQENRGRDMGKGECEVGQIAIPANRPF